MPDDIAHQLKDAASQPVSDVRPDLQWVMRRGHSLRARRGLVTRGAAIVAMGVVVASAVLLAGGEGPNPIQPTRPFRAGGADGATLYGKTVLPDDELIDAIPPGYELGQIVRNDEEYGRKGWVTVGVRLVPEHLSYARVIFYILPTEADAVAMYEEQSGQTRLNHRHLGGPKALPVAGIEPSLCGAGLPGLWTCHATAGRLYLVTQSGNYPAGARKLDPDHRRYGEELVRSFGALMR